MRGIWVGLFALAIAACGSDGGSSGGSSGSSGNTPPEPTKPTPDPGRATDIPECTVFVDAAASGAADGSQKAPHKTLGAAVSAADAGAVICVAEGTYAEELSPGAKYFTLAGGFKTGDFTVRDSSKYVTKAQGNGSSTFFKVSGESAPKTGQLTAIDGFEITGYSQAIVRDTYFSQSFDITNNHIHDNACASGELVGGGFSLNNVSGKIVGNVFSKNKCSRGGAGALRDTTGENAVTVSNNRVTDNVGTEPQSSHGGAFYLFADKLTITNNVFTGNSATGWGGGLYVGAIPTTHTKATLAWNVYRDNRAGSGGGFFCDDSAVCNSDHEIYDSNCGGNIYLDCGPGGGPTIANFDHLTNVRALAKGCSGPGPGVVIDKDNTEPDRYTFTNALFWGNATNLDFATSCVSGCDTALANVRFSNVQTAYTNGGVKVLFGEGIAFSDPLFVAPDNDDFHLKSKNGHYTPSGYVKDDADSPALQAGDPKGAVDAQPERSGTRTELGAYGNSAQASYVR